MNALLRIIDLNHLRFALPSLSVMLMKLILSKKQSSILKSEAISILSWLCIQTIADDSIIIKKILENRHEKQIKAIRSMFFSQKTEISTAPPLPKDATPFSVQITEEWLDITASKFSDIINQIFKSLSSFDLENLNVSHSLLEFSISLIQSCQTVLKSSVQVLIQIMAISYFFEGLDSDSHDKYNKLVNNLKLYLQIQVKFQLFLHKELLFQPYHFCYLKIEIESFKSFFCGVLRLKFLKQFKVIGKMLEIFQFTKLLQQNTKIIISSLSAIKYFLKKILVKTIESSSCYFSLMIVMSLILLAITSFFYNNNLQIFTSLIKYLSFMMQKMTISGSQSFSSFYTLQFLKFIKSFIFFPIQLMSLLNNLHLQPCITEETYNHFFESIFRLKRIPREVEYNSQKSLLCISLNYSWLLTSLNTVVVPSDDHLGNIYNVMLLLTELNSWLVSEIIELSKDLLDISPDSSQIIDYYDTSLFETFQGLLSTLPSHLKLPFFNYIISVNPNLSQQEFDSNSDILLLTKNLILLQLLAQNNSILQIQLARLSLGLHNNCSIENRDSCSVEHFQFALCDALCDPQSLFFSQIKLQEQNKIILAIFELMSASHESTRLHAEYNYLCLLRQHPTSIIADRYTALIDLLMVKLEYFYFEKRAESALLIVASMIERTPDLFARCVGIILDTILRCFDKYYQDEFMWVIEHFLPIFVKILKYAGSFSKKYGKESAIIKPGIVRQVLLRVKPLLASQRNSLVCTSLMVLRESFAILIDTPMDREDPGVFSPEDPDNVVIPNSLTAIFYEYWNSVIYQLNSQNLPTITECFKICGQVASFAPDFFRVSDRFDSHILPRVLKLLQKGIKNQLFVIKAQKAALQLLLKLKGIISSKSQKTISDLICKIFRPQEANRDESIHAFKSQLIELRDLSVNIMSLIKEPIPTISRFPISLINTIYDLQQSFQELIL